MKRLEGKSALITGAARGIGCGFAEAFVAEGATVAISDINLDAAIETAARIGDAAYPVQIDVGDQGSIDAAVACVVSKVGKLDILVNNAGLALGVNSVSDNDPCLPPTTPWCNTGRRLLLVFHRSPSPYTFVR